MSLTKSSLKKQSKGTIDTSWDDGGVKDLRIASLLEKYSLPGTFYIIVDKIGEPGFLTWDDVKDLERRGFTIGSHTMTHPQDLKLLHDEDLHYEIQNSKDLIENVLGHTISKFCYPRGRYDERVRAKVAEAGYLEARGTGRIGVIEKTDSLGLPGSLHIFQRPELNGEPLIQFAKNLLDKVKRQGGYCNIWGHSKEIDENNLWDQLEEILAYAVT